MLDVDIDASTPAEADTTTTTSPPQTLTLTTPPASGPKDPPPPNLDLHLTLLLLPPLEKYTASSWHGVRSRAWGENHDGGSFKIEKVEWVDEGAEGRYQERGGEARRKRLRALSFGSKGLSGADGVARLAQGRDCGGSGLLGLRVLKVGGVRGRGLISAGAMHPQAQVKGKIVAA